MGIQKTIMLLAPGETEVIEVQGNFENVERFAEEITRHKPDRTQATKLDLPRINKEMYVFYDKSAMIMAKDLWERQYKNWPS